MKELEDYENFPAFLRNYQTEYIGFAVSQLRIYDVFIDLVRTQGLSAESMTDLCSGSGEPALSVYQNCRCFERLVLSDKHPESILSNERLLNYAVRQYDVLKMDFRSDTCYTMFNSFHHFSDSDKVKIMRNISESGSKGFIVEILEPTLINLFKVILATTFGVLLLSPFVRPYSLGRIFFTYVLPINVLTITIDGVLSVLKSKTRDQYREMLTRTDIEYSFHLLKGKWASLLVIELGS